MATGQTARVSTGQPGQDSCLGRSIDDLHLTEEQREYLDRQFKKSKNPHPSEVMLISAECGLTEEEVMLWFAHLMAKWRQEQGLNPISTRLC